MPKPRFTKQEYSVIAATERRIAENRIHAEVNAQVRKAARSYLGNTVTDDLKERLKKEILSVIKPLKKEGRMLKPDVVLTADPLDPSAISVHVVFETPPPLPVFTDEEQEIISRTEALLRKAQLLEEAEGLVSKAQAKFMGHPGKYFLRDVRSYFKKNLPKAFWLVYDVDIATRDVRKGNGTAISVTFSDRTTSHVVTGLRTL